MILEPGRRALGIVVLILVLSELLTGCFLFNASLTARFSCTLSQSTPPCVVEFDASSSHAQGGVIVKYAWSFGDGSDGTGKATSHAYTASGAFTVQLTVTDNWGKESTASETITVLAAYVPPAGPPEPPIPQPPALTPGVVRFEGYDSPASLLPIPEGAGNTFFMEYAARYQDGARVARFKVVLLDAMHQQAGVLANQEEDFEGRREGGGAFLDVVALGYWAITVVGGTIQAPPQTYLGCEQTPNSPLLAHYSPLFTLEPGTVTFYYSDSGGWGGSFALLDYSRNVEIPLSHEVDVLGGTYLLKIRSSGCWKVSVEQAQ
jgi:PKD repeat protein